MMVKSKLERTIEQEQVTEEEAVRAIKGLRKAPQRTKRVVWSKKSFRFGYWSDLHVGHEKFESWRAEAAIDRFRRAEVDFVCNPGDHLEGMSGRPGHIYELSGVGFQQQINILNPLYEKLNKLQIPHWGIDGNHDQWYHKKNNGGLIVGDELAARYDNYVNLGQDEGHLVVDNVDIMLFHAGDGSAYAHSYKLQKLIESFSGGEKPNIVLSGHYHKALYQFSRGVHGFECGTLCGQSAWMRGKKIQAHMGFGIVDVWHNKQGVERLVHEFVPFYE